MWSMVWENDEDSEVGDIGWERGRTSRTWWAIAPAQVLPRPDGSTAASPSSDLECVCRLWLHA